MTSGEDFQVYKVFSFIHRKHEAKQV